MEEDQAHICIGVLLQPTQKVINIFSLPYQWKGVIRNTWRWILQLEYTELLQLHKRMTLPPAISEGLCHPKLLKVLFLCMQSSANFCVTHMENENNIWNVPDHSVTAFRRFESNKINYIIWMSDQIGVQLSLWGNGWWKICFVCSGREKFRRGLEVWRN